MPVYNFKSICVVPSAKDFVDIILSKTQRQTPTVVHKGYKISRIRSFYMRKVKFTHQNYHDRLTQILEDFPRMDDIHPFYADLINVLYSKDHYKLALGQINMARTLIDNIGKDYAKLIKFGDSLYRCKELKRAALGRMCTVMKKLNASLGYLEQVRQHLSRLPSIDPNSRTLMITGYPNVGKSSFINKVSRADVEVQPYAFTTKSLFVGHTDYQYSRWQVIDTPGLLDHPLEDMNTIEMQSITALAHLHATVMFFIDISESCGYTIKQQCSLFHSIKPLFQNKPLLLVATKIDLKKLEDVDPEDRALIDAIGRERNTKVMTLSNMTEEGISTVKATACDMLLQFRVERKLQSKRVTDVLNRITITQPTKRDSKARPVCIPESVLAARAAKAAGQPVSVQSARKTEKDIEREEGGPGVYVFQPQKHFKLASEDWKWDVVPEIMDGKNVADFVDPDIEARLAELEAEEERLQAEAEAAGIMDDEESEVDEETRELAEQIKEKEAIIKMTRSVERTQNHPTLPKRAKRHTPEELEAKLSAVGLPTEKLLEDVKSMSRGRKRRHHEAEETAPAAAGTGMDDESGEQQSKKQKKDAERAASKSRAASRARSRSKTAAEQGMKSDKEMERVRKIAKKHQFKKFGLYARRGESDRHVPTLKPKHLFSGKSTIGTNDRR